MNPFFSIIVPCCDVAPYVRECLDSVKGQAFADWECIAVVETSKDDTERIVREIAVSDGRFKVFTEPRSGSPATPRNTGLDHACGEYVIFLDGDDMLADGSLARLAARIRERPGADIYPCAFVDWREGRGSMGATDNWPSGDTAVHSGPEAVALMYARCHTPCAGAPFSVYGRGFLESADLRFVPGLVHEDEEFMPRAYCLARRVVPLHEPFYLYRSRDGSIMSASRSSGPNLEHSARVLKSLFAFHASAARGGLFGKDVSRLFGRAWIALIRNFWFDAEAIASIPRRQRVETLREAFVDGFGDFRALLAAAPLPRRVAGWCVMAFVGIPVLRPVAELFLARIYGKIARLRSGR